MIILLFIFLPSLISFLPFLSASDDFVDSLCEIKGD